MALVIPSSYSVSSGEPAAPPAKQDASRGWLAALVVTSVTLHLLLTGVLGFGVGEDSPPRPAQEKLIPPTTIEQVKLEPAPVEEKSLEALAPPEELPPEVTPVASDLDLPPLPDLTPVTAVPTTVPVAFAIAVKGPVHLTTDPARATGAIGGHSGPVSLDANGSLGKNLVLPALSYPSGAAQRRISGTVDIEFQVAPGGNAITEARVHRSSGFGELDSAALQNLRKGRWFGAPGYYVKTFSFVLN